MAEFLGRKLNLPKRPPPKKERVVHRRPPAPIQKKPARPQYETHAHVHMYKHRKVKTFRGPASKEEAKTLVAKLKYKYPQSKYLIKTEKVPRRRLL